MGCDGENITDQIAKMVFTLGCYDLTLVPFQMNKSCSEILDCLFRNTEQKKERENVTLERALITPKAKEQ